MRDFTVTEESKMMVMIMMMTPLATELVPLDPDQLCVLFRMCHENSRFTNGGVTPWNVKMPSSPVKVGYTDSKI